MNTFCEIRTAHPARHLKNIRLTRVRQDHLAATRAFAKTVLLNESCTDLVDSYGFQLQSRPKRTPAAATLSRPRTATSQKCAVVQRQARIEGSQAFVALNYRLESNKKKKSGDSLCRRPPHSREGGSGKALPTETKVESGASQSKSELSTNLSNTGNGTYSTLALALRTQNMATHAGTFTVIPPSGDTRRAGAT